MPKFTKKEKAMLEGSDAKGYIYRFVDGKLRVLVGTDACSGQYWQGKGSNKLRQTPQDGSKPICAGFKDVGVWEQAFNPVNFDKKKEADRFALMKKKVTRCIENRVEDKLAVSQKKEAISTIEGQDSNDESEESYESDGGLHEWTNDGAHTYGNRTESSGCGVGRSKASDDDVNETSDVAVAADNYNDVDSDGKDSPRDDARTTTTTTKVAIASKRKSLPSTSSPATKRPKSDLKAETLDLVEGTDAARSEPASAPLDVRRKSADEEQQTDGNPDAHGPQHIFFKPGRAPDDSPSRPPSPTKFPEINSSALNAAPPARDHTSVYPPQLAEALQNLAHQSLPDHSGKSASSAIPGLQSCHVVPSTAQIKQTAKTSTNTLSFQDDMAQKAASMVQNHVVEFAQALSAARKAVRGVQLMKLIMEIGDEIDGLAKATVRLNAIAENRSSK